MSDLSWMRPKLAELAGRDITMSNGCYVDLGTQQTWRPDEDVAQAVRCLEALDYKSIDLHTSYLYPDESKDCRWTVTIGLTMSKHDDVSAKNQNLPRAICLAISQALGWTEEAAERGER